MIYDRELTLSKEIEENRITQYNPNHPQSIYQYYFFLTFPRRILKVLFESSQREHIKFSIPILFLLDIPTQDTEDPIRILPKRTYQVLNPPYYFFWTFPHRILKTLFESSQREHINFSILHIISSGHSHTGY
jgi:hypothetical protein